MKKIFLFRLLLFCVVAGVQAQPVGRVRGVVVDAASGRALSDVTIVIAGTNPTVHASSNEHGIFSLPYLKVGRYDIEATLVGYDATTVRGVVVTSAREAVVRIAMNEAVQYLDEIVVTARAKKEEPLNQMALIGARMLSVDEASNFAGGLDDPARLATSFAGTAGEVTSNAIAIRGNSPQSLQWRLEGIEIPNPSHYPEVGSVGGGILTAFSSHVLGNSDFFTGAFPAQYDNALSGVFDMMLRNGNNERYEHTAQFGTLGVEFASEGPFKKGGRGSYLFNYRYSSMALAGDIVGGGLKEVSGMKYQDLSFKINLPTSKAGNFTLWGIGTNDRYTEPLDEEFDPNDGIPSEESSTRQYMGVLGLGHQVFLNERSYLKSTLAATYAFNRLWSDEFRGHNPAKRIAELEDKNTNLVLTSFLNTKFSARHTNRTGLTVTGLFYDDNYSIAPGYPYHGPSFGTMEKYADADGRSGMASAFTQSMFQMGERWTSEIGLNASYFRMNREWAVEPRVSLRYRLAAKHTLGLAGGMHSRHERLDYYFVEKNGLQVNRDLSLTKALHAVMSWDWQISQDVHLRVEPYFQYLYDVPVIEGTEESIINLAMFFMNDELVSSGNGRNYGLDVTLEKYLTNGVHWMFTGSLFDSKYRTSKDGEWHNTRYNRHFVMNALGGKEWMMGRDNQHTLGVSLRVSVMGGRYYTPGDEEASDAADP